MENLEVLNEVELYALREKNPPPMKEMFVLGTFFVSYFSAGTWLMTKYGRDLIKKIVPAHRRNFGSIVVKGTIIAGTACGLFGILAYGLIHQMDMFPKWRRRNAVNKQMIKIYLREDVDFQNFNLIDNMEYYDMPPDMVDRAKEILRVRREKLKREKGMLIYLLDEDEEE
jgi:hypothetical protein